MNKAYDAADLVGRILIAAIFIAAGYDKIGAYAGTAAYMESMGVPGALLPLVIATELGGGILVVLGLFTRYAALALAGFSILAAALFHANFMDQMQQMLFMKDFAMGGGFLLLFARGAGPLSLDARLARGKAAP